MIKDGYSKEVTLTTGKACVIRRPNGKSIAPIIGLSSEIKDKGGAFAIGKNIDMVCQFIARHSTEIEGNKASIQTIEDLDYGEIMELMEAISKFHFDKEDAEKNS